MAVPTIRRYTSGSINGTATVVTAVAANRALVGRVVISSSAAVTMTITAGGAVILRNYITANAMAPLTIPGVCLLAGDTLTVAAGATGADISFFGEEIDN